MSQSTTTTAPAPAQTLRLTDKAAWRMRVAPMLILSITVPVLILAAVLRPAASGVGTHRQLGLPACGIYRTTGVACVTCGYTTAFALAAHGRLVQAFITQPAAATAAVCTAALAIISVYALITGISLAPLGSSLWRATTICVAGMIVLGAWVYKIAVMKGLI